MCSLTRDVFTHKGCVHSQGMCSLTRDVFSAKGCVHSLVMYSLTRDVFSDMGCVHSLVMSSLIRHMFTHQWFGWPLDQADNLDRCLIFVHLIGQTGQLRLVVPRGNPIMSFHKPLTTAQSNMVTSYVPNSLETKHRGTPELKGMSLTQSINNMCVVNRLMDRYTKE